uniref:Uncharacterized protein n=1 Tax=Acrobeloides nanus TaxID=290746 RepID=A0A914CDI6_9BILA
MNASVVAVFVGLIGYSLFLSNAAVALNSNQSDAKYQTRNISSTIVAKTSNFPTKKAYETAKCYSSSMLLPYSVNPRTKVECNFDENEACFTFTDLDLRNNQTMYGCAQANEKYIPRECNSEKAKNSTFCEEAYYNGHFGLVCCCQYNDCNSFHAIQLPSALLVTEKSASILAALLSKDLERGDNKQNDTKGQKPSKIESKNSENFGEMNGIEYFLHIVMILPVMAFVMLIIIVCLHDRKLRRHEIRLDYFSNGFQSLLNRYDKMQEENDKKIKKGVADAFVNLQVSRAGQSPIVHQNRNILDAHNNTGSSTRLSTSQTKKSRGSICWPFTPKKSEDDGQIDIEGYSTNPKPLCQREVNRKLSFNSPVLKSVHPKEFQL